MLREALHNLGRNESQVSLDQLVLQSRRRNRSVIRKRKAAWSRTPSDALKLTKNGSMNAFPPDLIMEVQFDSGLVASNATTGSGGYSVEQNREPNQRRQDKGARTVERCSPDPMSRSLFEWNDQRVEHGQGSCDETMRKQMIISRCVEVLTSLLQMTGSLTGDNDSDSSQPKMDPNTLSNQNKLPEKGTEQAVDMAQSVKIMVTSTTNSDPLANSLMASSDQGDTGGLGNSITTIPRSATAESLQLHLVKDNSGHNHLKRSYRSLIGECVEVRVSPVVSRKGYLMVLEAKTGGWLRRWFVVRRPFLFIYADEHDPVERGLINLTTAKLDYDVNAAFANSPPPNGNHKTDLFRLPTSAESTVLPPTALVTVSTQFNMFTLIGQHHTLLIQTSSESGSDIHDWLYALNPLKAGEIRSGNRVFVIYSTELTREISSRCYPALLAPDLDEIDGHANMNTVACARQNGTKNSQVQRMSDLWHLRLKAVYRQLVRTFQRTAALHTRNQGEKNESYDLITTHTEIKVSFPRRQSVCSTVRTLGEI
ncbi:uncharacterized protein DEA37_0007252 [Paragonimus westermani]|uniref:PH domain-containing protein n=1 Tax=Paragonimus westermani TaxID=34504 RepID=A0A5J4NJ73_9TREM|nr:uncharacterized protein DEA37_0007252 [Paragonimus westermani]